MGEIKKINLISLSSAKGGGKDVVAAIIELIDVWASIFKGNNNNIHKYIHETLSDTKKFKQDCLMSKWENKKFAKKLKQIAAILLGVTEEKLEDREFKNSVLPPEWDLWKVSYKEEKGDKVYIKYFSEYEDIEPWFFETGNYNITEKKISCTPRLFMQLIGTEAIRVGLHSNAWVNALFADYEKNRCVPYCQKLNIANPDNGCTDMSECDFAPYWIITDTRFENELQAVKNKGGITVRVDSSERLDILRVAKAEKLAQIELSNDSDDIFYQSSDGNFHLMNNSYQEKFDKLYKKHYDSLEDTHSSENEWKTWDFDYTIDNNKDLSHLIKEVIKFYEHYY